jgi:GTP-binding protein HflX
MYTPENDRSERCILVGVGKENSDRFALRDHLYELSQLVRTAGAIPVGEIIQERSRLDPAFFIGKGKARELAQALKERQAQLAVFDDDLSPAQVRNLEKICAVKIVDRSGIILDIFARHARSRAARTQVELAQLNYLLPRLTRQWSHLSRQVGGIGTKGPGETQLETDRRLVRTRIAVLKRELEKIDQQRATQRKRRSSTYTASLVGYTNVGKSTLMNALTGADVLVENQLFATLDATTRRLALSEGQTLLLADTVGFIRKLPHHLVASFKSTLDAVTESDLIVHVMDVTAPNFRQHKTTVESVLTDLGAGKKPVLHVFNKIDAAPGNGFLADLQSEFPEAVFISASRGIKLQQLRQSLQAFVDANFVTIFARLGHSDYGLRNEMHDCGHVLHEQHDNNGLRLAACIARIDYDRFQQRGIPGLALISEDQIAVLMEEE